MAMLSSSVKSQRQLGGAALQDGQRDAWALGRTGEDEQRVARRHSRGQRRRHADAAADRLGTGCRCRCRAAAAAEAAGPAAATLPPARPTCIGDALVQAARELAVLWRAGACAAPVADGSGVVLAVEGGGAGQRQRLQVGWVVLQRLLDQLQRLAQQVAALLHGQHVGLVDEDLRVARCQLQRACEGAAGFGVALHHRIAAPEHDPAFEVGDIAGRLLFHALGQLGDHRLHVLRRRFARRGARLRRQRRRVAERCIQAQHQHRHRHRQQQQRRARRAGCAPAPAPHFLPRTRDARSRRGRCGAALHRCAPCARSWSNCCSCVFSTCRFDWLALGAAEAAGARRSALSTIHNASNNRAAAMAQNKAMLSAAPRPANGARARFRWPAAAPTISAAADVEDQAQQRHTQQHEGPAPQQPGAALHRRAVEHEVTVALHHEVEDLRFALPLLQLQADLLAQVHRQVGVRRSDGLVLAHQAAQLLGDAHHLGLEHRVLGARSGFLGHGQAAQQRQHQQQQPMH